MRAAFATFLVLFGSVLFAQQHSNEYSKCIETANTQVQMNQCAGDELKRQDAAMNQDYQALLQAHDSDSLATQKLRAAQQAWLAFRDAHMEELFPAADKQAQYGSMYPVLFALEEASVTRQRASMLKQMLKPGK